MEYYILFEKLIRELTALEDFDLEAIYAVLGEMCRIFRVSKAVTQFFNSVKEEQLGRGETYVCYDDGKENSPAMVQRIVTEGGTVASSTVYTTPDAEPWTEEERERVALIQKSVLSFISRSRLQRIVAKLTYFDSEGYPNLRYFFREIDRLESRGELMGMAAVHFNLKHFTMVNQQVGRSYGSFAMRGFFEHLGSIVGEGGAFCRVGGDNFVGIFAVGKLGEVLEALAGIPVVYDVNTGSRVTISASAGVFVIPEGFEYYEPGQIMDIILTASQTARSGEYGNVVYYNMNLKESRERIMQLERLFPEALRGEEFQVYYQPKIDIETGELAGAEALCRWLRNGEVVPPVEFIPYLEQSLNICTLDFYMLDHVCADIRRWLDEGRPVVRISVNLSRRHMHDPDLYQHIVEIVDRHNVPHKYVEIELTETTTDVEFTDLKRVVQDLQRVGIYTSVDDFGIGYSSLNLIKEIPWNVLKVDKSFLPVLNEDDGSVRSIMFKYVIAMAKALGLECVAEGVESKCQVDLLRQYHCDIAQGFYFDKPMPIRAFEERLAMHTYEVP